MMSNGQTNMHQLGSGRGEAGAAPKIAAAPRMDEARAVNVLQVDNGYDGPAPLLIHVGHHKTGTTWLQKFVFNDERLGFSLETGRPRHRIAQDFVCPDVFQFDAQATKASYDPWLRQTREAGLTLVVSHERLSGYPASGGYDRRLLAERLSAVFPDGRILIVLREQRSLIRSMYSQYVTDGGDETITDFMRPLDPRLGRMPRFRFEFYEFDHVIRCYQALFGPQNVLVLPFEMLKQTPHEFVSRVARFCRTVPLTNAQVRHVNDSRPLLMQAFQRVLNRHFSRNELSPAAALAISNLPKRFGRLRPIFERMSPRPLEAWLDKRLRAHIANHVGDRYGHSNARTSRLIGLNLADYGYPCDQVVPETQFEGVAACA